MVDGFGIKIYTENIKKIININERDFYYASEKLLNLAKKFEEIYPFAKNIQKFDSFSSDDTP